MDNIEQYWIDIKHQKLVEQLRKKLLCYKEGHIFRNGYYLNYCTRCHKEWHRVGNWSEYRGQIPVFLYCKSRTKPHHIYGYRNPRTTQERRQNSDPEYKCYVRPARRMNKLPNSYDDIHRSRKSSGWKNNRKAYKQWDRLKKK